MDQTYNNMKHLMAVKGENEEQILGKLLYFSLSNLMISREDVRKICEQMQLSIGPSNRISSVDAFRSATGDIHDRKETKTSSALVITKIYFRDNKKLGENTYSRELVRETINEYTNRYQKLANVYYDKDMDEFDYTISSGCGDYDVEYYCLRARDLFHTYKACVQGKQIETLTSSLLAQMESTKIDVHGRLYFVPKKYLSELSIFEDFMEALSERNLNNTAITINSMFVSDDQKQREKMAGEFCKMAKKDIDFYIDKIENLIAVGSKSPTVINRWLLKIEAFEGKKRYYENLLQQEMDDLNDSFTTLKVLSQELSLQTTQELKKVA